MRISDNRLGRFLSVDPLTHSYPWYSPYQFAGNNPIENIDLDGLEENSQSTYVYMRVPILANKPKSTADNSTKAMNLGTFRMPKASYNEAPWLSLNPFGQTKVNTFGWNVQVSAWNQGVESVEFGYNYLTTKEYRKEFQHVVNKAAWKGLMWMIGTDSREKAKDIKNYASNVNNWEDIAGALLLGKVMSGFLNKAPNLQEGNKIINNAVNDGVDFIIAQTPDDIAYMKEMGAKAMYMTSSEGKGSILIQGGAKRSHILEEAIHHQQAVKYGEDYFYSNRTKLEIEAQNKLLDIGKKEGWSKPEMNEIRKAKSTWESKLKKGE